MEDAKYETNQEKEKKMKRGTRFIILLSALLIAFVGFNMIASPYINTVKIGKEAGFHIISNYLSEKECEAQTHPYAKKDCD
jgi:hypothetical protein